MSDVYCDIHEWTKFDLDVLDFVENQMPKETKKFMRREGGRARTFTKKTGRSLIHKKTGNYFKGIKSSKAWRNSKGDYGVKVYANNAVAPHTHLIEYGHKVVTHTGRDTGYRAKDFHVYEKAREGLNGK